MRPGFVPGSDCIHAAGLRPATLASNILQSLNGAINSVWVGQLLGKTAVAATTSANLVMFMVFALSFGLSMAITVLIGQSMGCRDIDGMRRFIGAGVMLFALVGGRHRGGRLDQPAPGIMAAGYARRRLSARAVGQVDADLDRLTHPIGRALHAEVGIGEAGVAEAMAKRIGRLAGIVGAGWSGDQRLLPYPPYRRMRWPEPRRRGGRPHRQP